MVASGIPDFGTKAPSREILLNDMKYLDPLAVDSETSFQIVASGRPDFGTISITVKCYERKRIAKFNHILPKPIEYENESQANHLHQ